MYWKHNIIISIIVIENTDLQVNVWKLLISVLNKCKIIFMFFLCIMQYFKNNH